MLFTRLKSKIISIILVKIFCRLLDFQIVYFELFFLAVTNLLNFSKRNNRE